MSDRIDGAFLVYPIAGEEEGAGGDAYSVAYFGDDELAALRFVNRNPGYRAVWIVHGETILKAEDHRD